MREYPNEAWAAGLFEGEGYLYKGDRGWQLGIEMKDLDVLESFMRVFGETRLYTRDRGNGNHYTIKYLQRDVQHSILRAMLPFLHERRRAKCEEFFQWYEKQNHNEKRGRNTK